MNSSLRVVVLVILDGWGIAPASPGNAISLANAINVKKFWLSFPHTQLEAAGEAVGLPRGEDGNTETGHLNLGAGRIVYQDLERINMAIAEGVFFQNPVLLGAIEHAKKYNSSLHFMGLIGAGGVHSSLEHLFALIQLANRKEFKNVYLHLFTDGRDSPPTSAKTYIKLLSEVTKREGIGKLVSLMGRYWAMDRDQRWDRTAKAYFALTKGQGRLVKTPEEAIDISYTEGKTDEFIPPSLITDESGSPIATIKDNDAVVFFNFRIDRPRQLSKAFIFDDFSKAPVAFDFDPYKVNYEKTHLVKEAPVAQLPFERGPMLKNLYFATMSEYSKTLKEAGAKAAFPPEIVEAPIGAAVSSAGLRQLRITESEKERFVTFHFNGLREPAFAQEERIIIASPKVSTYDQAPEMSSRQITETLLAKLENDNYKFVVVNFPNPDMVGHTGNIDAAIKGIEAVDIAVGKLANFVLGYGGALLVTSDHGNAEEMINPQTGEVDTEHSGNPVPFIAIANKFVGKSVTLHSGILADIAPTALSLMEIPIPSSMTGKDLLQELVYR